MYFLYELETWSRDLNSDFTLKECLIGSVKIAKSANPDKYVYSGYGIGFHSRSEFLLSDGSVGKNVIIFGVDISSAARIDNKKKDTLIVRVGPTQGLDDTMFTAGAQRSNRKFCFKSSV